MNLFYIVTIHLSYIHMTQVSRSLAACQGALLLVDSTQGIQAQTIANYKLAKAANLNIIPVITKIDLVSIHDLIG